MAAINITNVATLSDGLESIQGDKTYTSPAIGFDGSFSTGENEHALETYFGYDPKEGEATRQMPKKDISLPSGNFTSGEVDSSELNDLSILKRDGKYLISFRDSAMLWDSWLNMRNAFLIWLLSLKEGDMLVIDALQDITESLGANWLVEAITVFGTIESSPANVTVRVNGLVGGISGYLALVADTLEVGELGELVIEPIARMSSNTYTAAYKPFFLDILSKGREKGILTDEEEETILTGHDVIVLSRQTLIDRGVQSA